MSGTVTTIKRSETKKIPALIDELGRLDIEYQSFKPKLDRREAIRKQLHTAYESRAPDQPVIAEGSQYTLHGTVREEQRKIKDLPKVFRRLGTKAFVAACSFTLKALVEAVGEDEAKEFITQARTGNRTWTTVQKLAPAIAAKKAA